MNEYLKALAVTIFDPDARIKALSLAAAVVGPLLTQWLLTPAMVTVVILWSIDFAMGSYKAIRSRTWRPRRATWSAIKLFLYVLLLGFGEMLRWGIGGYAGAGVLAAFTTTIVLTEASSVLIHAAELCPEEAGPVKGILRALASISSNARQSAENAKVAKP